MRYSYRDVSLEKKPRKKKEYQVLFCLEILALLRKSPGVDTYTLILYCEYSTRGKSERKKLN